MVSNYTLFISCVMGTMYIYRKNITFKVLLAVSDIIDIWYDLKYSYWIKKEDNEDKDKDKVLSEIVSELCTDYYIAYKWYGTVYYTMDKVPPVLDGNEYINEDNSDITITLIYDDGTKLLLSDNTHKTLIRLLSGPNQDFSISMKPTLKDLKNIIFNEYHNKLHKIIYTNSNYEEFTFVD